MKTHKYKSYKEYKDIQVRANKAKLGKSWITPEVADLICDRIKGMLELDRTYISPPIGICHGTRRGDEQQLFSERLGIKVIGTEISPTASQFPNTIEWDFHRVKDEWLGACDFIYSNSLDHAKNPLMALKAWLSCLKPDGVLVIEWVVKLGRGRAKKSTPVDPFSATTMEVCELILKAGGEAMEILPIIKPGLQEAIIFARRK